MDPEPHAPTGPQKPLDEAIAEYLMACEAESKSPRTVQAYDETLRVFREQLIEERLVSAPCELVSTGGELFRDPKGWICVARHGRHDEEEAGHQLVSPLFRPRVVQARTSSRTSLVFSQRTE